MGFGARVVRTAIAQLTAHGLVQRYQVEEHNEESIGLARSIGPCPIPDNRPLRARMLVMSAVGQSEKVVRDEAQVLGNPRLLGPF